MKNNFTDDEGRTITVYFTDDMYSWTERSPYHIVPIGNYIGTIQFGQNSFGEIVSHFYAGYDNDIGPEAVVIWESMDRSQMQDDIERIFLRVAIFIDEHEDEFDYPEPYVPYARAGVCAIIKSYMNMLGKDSYSLDMNNFKDEYMPYVTAIYKGESIPPWDQIEDN